MGVIIIRGRMTGLDHWKELVIDPGIIEDMELSFYFDGKERVNVWRLTIRTMTDSVHDLYYKSLTELAEKLAPLEQHNPNEGGFLEIKETQDIDN